MNIKVRELHSNKFAIEVRVPRYYIGDPNKKIYALARVFKIDIVGHINCTRVGMYRNYHAFGEKK